MVGSPRHYLGPQQATTPKSSPVELDQRGRCTVFFLPSQAPARPPSPPTCPDVLAARVSHPRSQPPAQRIKIFSQSPPAHPLLSCAGQRDDFFFFFSKFLISVIGKSHAFTREEQTREEDEE